MKAPATLGEFLELVRRSGIVDEKRLAAYLEKDRASSPLPSEPKGVAECLVRDGLLTQFQAEQFLQGKWRRFTIGNYKVLERIGAGGMGSVYLCEHKFMRRRAAVKVLPAAKANDPSALERFYREARAVAALDHPNIVRAYDIDQEDNLHFLVMEYVDGSSLQEIVQKVGPLDPIRSAHYISQSAFGLQHAHETAGLVHRDIKPANILVDRSGIVKVLDMGLARFFHDEEDLLTKKYDENVLGTADYLAPEQALDSHSVDIRADIYSLGGTFYFCLTGRTPFTEGTVAQKLIWHQTRQPKPIRSFRMDVPDEMIAVIDKMMAKDPNQRYQTPLEITQALRPWTQDAIPPPAEVEMPRLCAAATGGSPGEASPALVVPALSGPSSSKTRKAWQVPPSPTPQPNPHAAPSDESPPQAKPAPALPGPAAAKAPEAKPVAIPALPAAKAREAKLIGTPMAPLVRAELSPPRPGAAAVKPAVYAVQSQKEYPFPWKNLAAAETEDLTAKADTEPRPTKKAASRRHRLAKSSAHAKHKRQQLWWAGGIAAGVLFGGLLGILLWSTSAREAPKDKGTPATRPPLFVSRSGHDNAFLTLREAVRKAQDNDRIVVMDDIEEQLDLVGPRKHLTIEPASDRAIVWRCPPNGGDGKYLLWLNGTGDLRLHGFTFDGRNLVDELVLLTGHCPGLTLENIQLQGFRRYGVLVANAAGKSDKRISLLHVRAATPERKEAAVAFAINSKVTSPKINQHILISDCRFEGPYTTPVRLFGDAAVIKDVEFSQNVPAILIQAPK